MRIGFHFAFVVLSALAVSSCASLRSESAAVHAPFEPGMRSQYILSLETRTQTALGPIVREEKLSIQQELCVGVESVDTDGVVHLALRFGRIRGAVQRPDVEYRFDSASRRPLASIGNGVDPEQAALDAAAWQSMQGALVRVTLGPDGVVRALDRRALPALWDPDDFRAHLQYLLGGAELGLDAEQAQLGDDSGRLEVGARAVVSRAKGETNAFSPLRVVWNPSGTQRSAVGRGSIVETTHWATRGAPNALPRDRNVTAELTIELPNPLSGANAPDLPPTVSVSSRSRMSLTQATQGLGGAPNPTGCGVNTPKCSGDTSWLVKRPAAFLGLARLVDPVARELERVQSADGITDFLFDAGAELPFNAAVELEQQVDREPKDVFARVRLVAHYRALTAHADAIMHDLNEARRANSDDASPSYSSELGLAYQQRRTALDRLSVHERALIDAQWSTEIGRRVAREIRERALEDPATDTELEHVTDRILAAHDSEPAAHAFAAAAAAVDSEREKHLLQAARLGPFDDVWAGALGAFYEAEIDRGSAHVAGPAALDNARRWYRQCSSAAAVALRLRCLDGLVRVESRAQAPDHAVDWGQRWLEAEQRIPPPIRDIVRERELRAMVGIGRTSQGQLGEAERLLAGLGKLRFDPDTVPDVRLARALLEKGRRSAVIDYLTDLERHWRGGERDVQRWIEQVRAGRAPAWSRFARTRSSDDPTVLSCSEPSNVSFAKRGSDLIGTAAPDFELADLNGVHYRLSNYRGRVVVLDFWATWCGPCMESLPLVELVRTMFPESQVKVFLVDLGPEDSESVRRIVQTQKIGSTPLLDETRVADLYGVRGIPDGFIIDHKGRIQRRGPTQSLSDAARTVGLIEQLVEGKQPSRTPVEDARILSVLRQAADGGDSDAEYRLGSLLHTEAHKFLKPTEDEPGLDWLHKAADRGNAQAARELARHYYSDSDAMDFQALFARTDDIDVERASEARKWYARAVELGDTRVTGMLVDLAIRFVPDPSIPLFDAVLHGDLESARKLLDHGADPNRAGKYGETALMVAARKGDERMVEELLRHRADPNRVNLANTTALIEGSWYGNEGVVRRLLDAGAKTEIAKKLGMPYTALGFAAMRGHVGVIRLLIEHGADPNAKSADGQSPLDIATRFKRPEVLRALQETKPRRGH